MADFRVYFKDFRKEFMIFMRYLDSFSAFDVCQNPSLRQNTMIPLILSPRYNIWQLCGNDNNDGAHILQTLRLQWNSNSHPGTIHDDSCEEFDFWHQEGDLAELETKFAIIARGGGYRA